MGCIYLLWRFQGLLAQRLIRVSDIGIRETLTKFWLAGPQGWTSAKLYLIWFWMWVQEFTKPGKKFFSWVSMGKAADVGVPHSLFCFVVAIMWFWLGILRLQTVKFPFLTMYMESTRKKERNNSSYQLSKPHDHAKTLSCIGQWEQRYMCVCVFALQQLPGHFYLQLYVVWPSLLFSSNL